MALKLKNYSTTPGNNNSTPPDGWPEGMAPSAVNNSAREMMARLREWYADAEWINIGHTIVSASGADIVISGDVTSTYVTGRAVRENVTTVGYVTNAVYDGTTNTTVTVSGITFAASPTTWEIGVLATSITAFARTLLDDASASAARTTLGLGSGDSPTFTGLTLTGALSVQGNTTIGNASGDTLTINGTAVSIPNGLNFDSNTLFIDATNNRVGIGTNTPGKRLSVDGDVLFNSGSGTPLVVQSTAGARAIINTTDGTFVGRFGSSVAEGYIVCGAQSNHPLALSTNNVERARITSGGNFLIGTTTETSGFSLQVEHSGSNKILNKSTQPGLVLLESDVVDNNSWIDNNAGQFRVLTANDALSVFTTRLTIDHASGSAVFGNAAIATTATGGFVYIPSCAGTPTGVPTGFSGRIPLVVDSTNNKLYFYSGGAWRDAGP